jgi:ribosomal protein S17
MKNIKRDEDNGNKTIIGRKIATVVGNSRYLEGTIKVMIETTSLHPLYGKVMKKKKTMVVDYIEKEILDIGTRVYILPCAPVSKLKRWRIVGVV